MPLQVKDEGAKTPAKATEKVVAQAAAKAQTPVAEVDSAVLGSKSATVAFVAALGDPSRDDITPANPEKGIARRVDPTIVGYAFKALEDMQVPDCGTPENLKDNPMAYVEGQVHGKKAVKAGETFYLTRFETGMLLSPEEFNGRATGGEMPVAVSYTIYGAKGKDGVTAKVSDATRVPSVALRPANQGMSIKDIAMINVLDFTTEKAENGQTRKKRTIKAGFEKWESLCKERTVAARGSRGTSEPKSVRNKNAATFLAIVNSKKA